MVGGVDTSTNSSCPGVVVLWGEILALLDYTKNSSLNSCHAFILIEVEVGEAVNKLNGKENDTLENVNDDKVAITVIR